MAQVSFMLCRACSISSRWTTGLCWSRLLAVKKNSLRNKPQTSSLLIAARSTSNYRIYSSLNTAVHPY